ncbi:transposase [Cereibacter changlensis JA139]|uniref:Transposase n=2 Tax=Cereibacter changlensis TaxID=402884 RepID=A0A2T4JNV8_9RHOB|nr:DDE-type integrase/transposase/recombinase [Cereibacter changlensis]PTE19576.1 transposase [Cereibacter changlensis JA139]PZX56380.1 integrase-like protein [Cereibacter changlensis]
MASRTEVLCAVEGRYRAAARAERGKILDEFVALTGYHRKHAIRLLAHKPPVSKQRRGRRPTYGPEVRTALLALWNLSDRLCSKRLKEMIPLLLPAAVRHDVIDSSEELLTLLLTVSAATMDRLLSEARLAASSGRRRRAGMSSSIRRDVPIRTFNDWGNPQAGFIEADFVVHGGTSVAGSFVQTLVLTDIATGWTECVPVVTRSAPLVIEALRTAMELFPFPLKGFDFDNDGSFMNDQVVPWCRENRLIVTRSRAYKKNDQAWVEQKNGAIVRRLVGYGRLEGLGAVRALNRLYAASRRQVNLCQPSFKLMAKWRIGAKVRKTWDRPRTPAERLLERTDISPSVRERVIAWQAAADPVELMRLVRQAPGDLGRRIDRRGQHAASRDFSAQSPEATASTVKVIAGADAPEELHRRPYRRKKPVPVRLSRLDPFIGEIRVWLSMNPALTGLAIHERLASQHGPLVSSRTVQRLVRHVRTELLQSEIAAASQNLNDVAGSDRGERAVYPPGRPPA